MKVAEQLHLNEAAQATAYLAETVKQLGVQAERFNEDKPLSYLALGGLNEFYSIQHDLYLLHAKLQQLADKANA